MQKLEAKRSENEILASLPVEEHERIRPHLESVQLQLHQVLYEPDDPFRYVYFPDSAVISLTATLEEGKTAEVGQVGREGMLGIRVFLGAHTIKYRAAVVVDGRAMRMRTEVLRDECGGCGVLHDLLLRYTLGLLTELRQLIACNRLHPVQGRTARWLLQASDRANSNKLRVTHEEMAELLGTRRSGVTLAALNLKNKGLIDYSHGRVRILDRKGLEANTCECYRVIKDEYGRVSTL